MQWCSMNGLKLKLSDKCIHLGVVELTAIVTLQDLWGAHFSEKFLQQLRNALCFFGFQLEHPSFLGETVNDSEQVPFSFWLHGFSSLADVNK